MATLSALICLAIAIVVGAWRSYCISCDRQARWNTPLAWHNPLVPLGSLLLVGATSLWPSIFFAETAGPILFGATLAFRWVVSSLLGNQKAEADIKRFKADYSKRYPND